jgi:hypothetical protein
VQRLDSTREVEELVPGEAFVLGDAFLADGGGAWRAFARTGELFVDGVSVQATPPLVHGQVIETRAGKCVRYLEREAPPQIPAALRAIARDAFGWRVLADWLEEHGDDRASAVRGAAESDEARVRRFGALARHFRWGNLAVTWAHGFPQRAVLRSLEHELLPSAAWCLKTLLESDESAFLAELHVDLASSMTTADQLAFELVEIARAAPPALKRLTLGPVRSIADEAAVLRALESLPFEASLARFQHCHIGGIAVGHHPQLLWFAGEPLAVNMTSHGPWLVRPEGRYLSPVRVNGHPCVSARLMHGDEIELANDVRVTVTLR